MALKPILPSGVVNIPITHYTATNTARVDQPNGNDDKGQINDLTKPFQTVAAALAALEANGDPTILCVVILSGDSSDFDEDLTTSLNDIAFVSNNVLNVYNSLTLTGSGGKSVIGINVSLSTITATTSNLIVDVKSGSSIVGNITNSGAINLFGSVYSGHPPQGTLLTGSNIRVDGFPSQDDTIDVNATGNVNAYFSLLHDVTAVDVTMNDSRFKSGGTLNISGTTTYADEFLTDRGGGGGGGLTVWDSGATYQTGTIVIDRGGQWKSLINDNTNSQPVSGNANWELVGGTPYIDVILDPPAIITTPFYDPSQTGPGVLVIPAPGAGKWLYVPCVATRMSDGDNWSSSAPNTILTYGDTSGLDAFAGNVIGDGLDSGFPFSSYPAPVVPGDTAKSVINKPLVLSTGTFLSLGSRSIIYRVFYLPLPVTAGFPDANFYTITAVDQGSKTFSINGDHREISGSIAVAGNTGGNDGDYTVVSVNPNPPSSPRTITAADPNTDSVTISGDHTDEFSEFGGNCVIQGSPANDGNYSYTTAVFDTDHTDIFFGAGVPPDGTAGGTILALANTTDIVVSEAIPDSTADGWVKQ